METVFESGTLTALVFLIASLVVLVIINEILKRIIQVRGLTVLIVSLGVIIAGSAILTIFENPMRSAYQRASGRWTFNRTRNPGQPIVVGIYPTDVFGPAHNDGLDAAFRSSANTVRVIDLTATYARMKSDDVPELLARLRELITTRNVIAVVGPPVTEFTGSVIRTVAQSGRRPPVFITSATAREPVGWLESDVPLYRINSGIDERAEEFAQFAMMAVANGVHLVFLVETDENSSQTSYGQQLFLEISSRLPQWQEWADANRISIETYPRGGAADVIARRPLAFLGTPKIIMLLGIGSDYRAVVDRFYRASHPRRMALLGGWMNAYATQALAEQGRYQWDLLLEIADIDISPSSESPARAAFRRTGLGDFTPPLRDQAFSFDAGTVAARAFREVLLARRTATRPPRIDDDFLGQMNRRIRAMRLQGVTGPIAFNNIGQNVGTRQARRAFMTYAFYDGASRRWQQVPGPGAVIQRVLRPPSAVAAPAAAPAAPARPGR